MISSLFSEGLEYIGSDENHPYDSEYHRLFTQWFWELGRNHQHRNDASYLCRRRMQWLMRCGQKKMYSLKRRET